MRFDYNFQAIEKDDGPVKMRIDYTNLQGYWDSITDSPATRKRSVHDQVTFAEWKSRVDYAKRSPMPLDREASTHFKAEDMSVSRQHRRWFGSFLGWLEKMTTLEKSDAGVLPMAFSKFFTLYSGRLTCTSDSGITITAGMDITTDIALRMNTRYSYYFSGTIAPVPHVNDVYAYAGVHPEVVAGITLSGDASLVYTTNPKRLIDTLTYPGLAIKGIAAVGPTLDIWGQIDGSVTVSGRMRAGVTYTFQPIEMYMPNTDETHDKATKELEEDEVDQQGLSPSFEANVRAEVDFNVRVSPEVNLGIKVGGGIGPLKVSWLDTKLFHH